MRSHSSPFRVVALLFALALLGAQFHFCADVAAGSSGSHVCQVCATAGHAVTGQALVAEFTPAVCRVEASCSQGEVPSLTFTITSPRAPPSL